MLCFFTKKKVICITFIHKIYGRHSFKPEKKNGLGLIKFFLRYSSVSLHLVTGLIWSHLLRFVLVKSFVEGKKNQQTGTLSFNCSYKSVTTKSFKVTLLKLSFFISGSLFTNSQCRGSEFI